MRLSVKSLILYLWGHAFSSRKQFLHTGTVKLARGIRQWFQPGCGGKILWEKGRGRHLSGCRPRQVEGTPSLMKDSGHAFAKHSEAFVAGQHWDPCAQVQLYPKGSPAANPESGLVVTRCVGGYTRKWGKWKINYCPFPATPKHIHGCISASGVRWGEQACPFCEKLETGVFSCGVRYVWQPWPLQLDLTCCTNGLWGVSSPVFRVYDGQENRGKQQQKREQQTTHTVTYWAAWWQSTACNIICLFALF